MRKATVAPSACAKAAVEPRKPAASAAAPVNVACEFGHFVFSLQSSIMVCGRVMRAGCFSLQDVCALLLSLLVQAASAALSFSAISARKREGGMPFCARNWRLKLETLL